MLACILFNQRAERSNAQRETTKPNTALDISTMLEGSGTDCVAEPEKVSKLDAVYVVPTSPVICVMRPLLLPVP